MRAICPDLPRLSRPACSTRLVSQRTPLAGLRESLFLRRPPRRSKSSRSLISPHLSNVSDLDPRIAGRAATPPHCAPAVQTRCGCGGWVGSGATGKSRKSDDHRAFIYFRPILSTANSRLLGEICLRCRGVASQVPRLRHRRHKSKPIPARCLVGEARTQLAAALFEPGGVDGQRDQNHAESGDYVAHDASASAASSAAISNRRATR